MKNFLRLATNVETTPLLLAIRRRPDLWKEDTYLRDYPQGPFASMESIMLRFPVKRVLEMEEAQAVADDKHPSIDQHECVDYPAFKILPEARPMIFGLMTAVQGERLGRVMVNKIAPGGSIYPHEDTPVHAAYWSRFHIVLDSSPGVVFKCGDEQTYMARGEVWWFENALMHEVVNNSGADRIHMIVDVRTSRP